MSQGAGRVRLAPPSFRQARFLAFQARELGKEPFFHVGEMD